MNIDQFPMRFGKYILLGRLAAGGMAEVFRAIVSQTEGFERNVAVKCMLPQLLTDEQSITMFRDEARLASQLLHPNIVQIYEHGRVGARSYIAMELVHGLDLRQILRNVKESRRRLSPVFAAYILSKAAAGLDFAHRKASAHGQPLNLVHRDVSPQNILVSYDGEVKVVDFGIAKAEMRSTETQAGTLKGKFAYMAPEQAKSAKMDRRADIFALGAVLYEAVTGQVLFTGKTDLSVLEKVRNARTPNFRTALPPGNEEIAYILERALAAHPDDRYSYASEMAEDLERLLVGDDRSVFGARNAAQVMHSIMGGEIPDFHDGAGPRSLPDDPFSSDFVPNALLQTDVPKVFGMRNARPMGGTSGVTSLLRNSLLPKRSAAGKQEAKAASPGVAPPKHKSAPAPANPAQRAMVQNKKSHRQPSTETVIAMERNDARLLYMQIAIALTLFLACTLVTVKAIRTSVSTSRSATTHAFYSPFTAMSHRAPATTADAEANRMSDVSGRSLMSGKVHVYIDGIDRGIEPIDQLQLPLGEHIVRLVPTDTALAEGK